MPIQMALELFDCCIRKTPYTPLKFTRRNPNPNPLHIRYLQIPSSPPPLPPTQPLRSITPHPLPTPPITTTTTAAAASPIRPRRTPPPQPRLQPLLRTPTPRAPRRRTRTTRIPPLPHHLLLLLLSQRLILHLIAPSPLTRQRPHIQTFLLLLSEPLRTQPPPAQRPSP